MTRANLPGAEAMLNQMLASLTLPGAVARVRLGDAPRPGAVPFAGRPEYEAQMRAWRKHGCPRPY